MTSLTSLAELFSSLDAFESWLSFWQSSLPYSGGIELIPSDYPLDLPGGGLLRIFVLIDNLQLLLAQVKDISFSTALSPLPG